jgi:SAM-dependent methyltransferase
MPIFQCKSCHKHLPFIFRWDNKVDGRLSCKSCGTEIPLFKGIPVYLPKEDFDRVEEFQKIYETSTSADPWQYDESAAEHLRYAFLKDLIQKEYSSAKRVLDMGCSGGHLLDHLDELPFEEYFAFDINFQAVLKASEKISSSKINKKRVTLFVANATDLPLENDTFDLILCVDGIIGWELSQTQKEKVFSEIQRLLKPGGSVLFVDYISRTTTAHLYPKVFSSLPLSFDRTIPIYDRLSYEFESAIKGLLWFSPFRQWKNNLPFAKNLSALAAYLGKHGAKHWAYIAKKPLPTETN